MAAGTSCSDGNACNGAEVCDGSGSCTQGSPVACGALDSCHAAGTCDPATGACSNPVLADGTSCNDGNACTTGDVCQAGACQSGSTTSVDDGNPCTIDACNSATGTITHTPAPSGTACSDGNICNGDETCDGNGACKPGTPPVIEDGDPCTLDTCDPVTGIEHHACTPNDTTVTTTPGASTQFLYQGTNPIQKGVAPGTIDLRRAAAIAGNVRTRDGAPLTGVTIDVLGHPELGTTVTQGNGSFLMAVNGGGQLTVRYQKTGYLPVQRQTEARWQVYADTADAVMIPVDAAVGSIDVTTAGDWQISQSNVTTDSRGSRRSTVLFPPGTQAMLAFANGTATPVNTLHVRSTEYTVGDDGPDTMPGELPNTSAYTYATELSADEAIQAGAEHVTFNQPVLVYTENFIGFPVGIDVPSGFYDRTHALWAAGVNGRVLKVLSITNGLADLDVTGSGTPSSAATLASLNITDGERAQLATLYTAGQSLWRVPTDHFSSVDFNWGPAPPTDAVWPDVRDPLGDVPESRDLDCQSGSVIECQNQTLGENVAIAGTPFQLHYQSDRVPGRSSGYTIDVELAGDKPLPLSLVAIKVRVLVAGQTVAPQSFGRVAPHTRVHISWDGKDRQGQPTQGQQNAHVVLDYVYQMQYSAPTKFGMSGGPNSTLTTDPVTVSLIKAFDVPIGTFNAMAEGLGGWTLSEHHYYDPIGLTAHHGDGTRQSAAAFGQIVETVAGSGTNSPLGDGGPAIKANLQTPIAMALGQDGSIFIADSVHGLIRRVGPDGIISTVMGGGPNCTFPNGAPATQFGIDRPTAVAVAPDGTLYVGEGSAAGCGSAHIWRVTPNGIATLIMGGNGQNNTGDGGPALAAGLGVVIGLSVGPDGNVYLVDQTNNRVKRIDANGIVNTVAGDGNTGGGADVNAEFATQASIGGSPGGIAFGPDGNLYIAARGLATIRRVSPDGRIHDVAGVTGQNDFTGDGGPAIAAKLNRPIAVAFGPDGSLYINDFGNDRIRRISNGGIISTIAGTGVVGQGADGQNPLVTDLGLSTGVALAVGPDGATYFGDTRNDKIKRLRAPFRGLSPAENIVASQDGSELYVFSGAGRHVRTLDAQTAATKYAFGYDVTGLLSSVTDGSGNMTTINRPSCQIGITGLSCEIDIIGPFGHTTTMMVDANGLLTSIANPAQETVQLTYYDPTLAQPVGLLKTLTDPRGGPPHTFSYDPDGRLSFDGDPEGGSHTLVRTGEIEDFTVTSSTTLDRTSTFRIQKTSNGGQTRTNTSPANLTTTSNYGADGSSSTTAPDGTVTTVKLSPDPRFAMQAPLGTVSVQTPSGLTYTEKHGRTAVLSNPADPLSLVSSTATRTLGSNTWTTAFTVATGAGTVTDPDGRKKFFTLDSLGRIASAQVDGLTATTNSFDTQGRLKTVTQGARSLTYSYGSDGLLGTVTDALSQQTLFDRDVVGRIKHQTLPDSAVIGYDYDLNGNLHLLTPPGRPTHTMEHSLVDLMSSYVPPLVPGAGTLQTGYIYDSDHMLTQVNRPDGLTIVATPDFAGRVRSLTLPTGTITYNYNPTTGHLDSLLGPTEENLSFGNDGDLVKDITFAGTVAGTVHHEFDDHFRVRSETVNGGSSVTTDYYGDGAPFHAGGLTLVRSPQTGVLTSTTLGSTSETYTPNAFGEVQDYTAKFGTTTLLAESYGSDALGRIHTKTETIGGTTHTTTYEYDLQGRLKDVLLDGVLTAHYEYDPNGNRTLGPSGEIGVPDDQDRLTSYGTRTYTYGANGELATKTDGGQNTTYAHDVRGNLTQVVLPTGTVINYVVDGLGRRVGKKVDGVLVRGFLYRDQLRVAAELDSSNNVVATFVYVSKGNVPDYMVKGGATYRIFSDHLGSPRLVVDAATGAVAQRIDYDGWGNVLLDSAPGFQPFGFAGGLHDADTGFVHFGARDYDPTVGRWIAKDPILFRGGQPNVYVYVGDDPVDSLDPSGLEPLPQLTQEVLAPFFPGFDLSQLDVRTNVPMKDPRALAFTEGNVMSFSENSYSPTTIEGVAHIAHEVTHAVQQAQNPRGTFWFTDPYSVERLLYGYKKTSYEVLAYMMEDAVLVTLREQYNVMQGDIRELSGEMMCR
jgi:RHS repeat-associated protein